RFPSPSRVQSSRTVRLGGDRYECVPARVAQAAADDASTSVGRAPRYRRRVRQWQRTETATAWDAGAGKQLPTRAEQQDLLLALLIESEIGDGSVLDLGIGSGLVAEIVLEA